MKTLYIAIILGSLIGFYSGCTDDKHNDRTNYKEKYHELLDFIKHRKVDDQLFDSIITLYYQSLIFQTHDSSLMLIIQSIPPEGIGYEILNEYGHHIRFFYTDDDSLAVVSIHENHPRAPLFGGDDLTYSRDYYEYMWRPKPLFDYFLNTYIYTDISAFVLHNPEFHFPTPLGHTLFFNIRSNYLDSISHTNKSDNNTKTVLSIDSIRSSLWRP